MCLSALVETEGFVCTACGLRLEAQLDPPKGRIVLGNLCVPGLPPHTSQQSQSRQKDSHSHRTGPLETPGFETPRSQGRDRKQELWGKQDNAELRAHFKGLWDTASESLQPKHLSGKLVVKSRECGIRVWVQILSGTFPG